MIYLTEKEKMVLDDITKDDFYENGLDSAIWADVFVDRCHVPAKEVRGVLSSLIKKGIIRPIQRRDGVIKFTQFGKTIMEELGY